MQIWVYEKININKYIYIYLCICTYILIYKYEDLQLLVYFNACKYWYIEIYIW